MSERACRDWSPATTQALSATRDTCLSAGKGSKGGIPEEGEMRRAKAYEFINYIKLQSTNIRMYLWKMPKHRLVILQSSTQRVPHTNRFR